MCRTSYTDLILFYESVYNLLSEPTALLGYSNAIVPSIDKDICICCLKNHNITTICMNTVSCIGEHSGISLLMLFAGYLRGLKYRGICYFLFSVLKHGLLVLNKAVLLSAHNLCFSSKKNVTLQIVTL